MSLLPLSCYLSLFSSDALSEVFYLLSLQFTAGGVSSGVPRPYCKGPVVWQMVCSQC